MAEAIKGTVSNLLEKLNLSSPKDEGVPEKVPTEDEVTELKNKYKQHGQEHVFTFFDDLSDSEKTALFRQLSDINPKYINEITDRALHPPKADESETKLEPLPESAVASVQDSKTEDLESWYAQGLELIAQNKVAVVLMAGGQGTRLGSSAPKGCFNIGLPSAKSLFQIQAERIWKAQKLAAQKHGKEQVVIPWYVMTSGPTRRPTEEFFEKHSFFGLSKENVMIFEQGVLPCISNDGKILLESKSKVLSSHTALKHRIPRTIALPQYSL